ncbi:hypothetical protein [Flavobacterium anhuiense]|uniref:hypothetical protein n=1 Tax=Flavobacterium anhuiense TaxID=459526 RepID=UPI00101BA4CE|nr:hypothetical protein [Flavobacterium anhuiense]
MKLQKACAVLLAAIILAGCSNDDSSAPMNTSAPAGSVTYDKDVKTIIDNNCIVCHAAVPTNGAPISLVTYAQVKDAVLKRSLIIRISLENGNSVLMPKGGPRMPQETIDIVKQWKRMDYLKNDFICRLFQK